MSDFEKHPIGTMEKIANQQVENWVQADRIVALEAAIDRQICYVAERDKRIAELEAVNQSLVDEREYWLEQYQVGALVKADAEIKRLREQLKEALTCALDADPIRYGFLHKHLQDLEEDSNDDVKERP